MLDIKKMIDDVGGIKKFSLKFNVPYRTVQNWSDGKRVPPAWLVNLFDAKSSPAEDSDVKQIGDFYIHNDNVGDYLNLQWLSQQYKEIKFKMSSLIDKKDYGNEYGLLIEKEHSFRHSIFQCLYHLYDDKKKGKKGGYSDMP